MEALIRFVQNNPIIILGMTIITVLSGIITIFFGWQRFYEEVLSRNITLPVYVYIIIFFTVVVLAVIFWPAIKDQSKELKVIKGETFGVQRLFVDGKHFVNCNFVGTELVFRGETGSSFKACGFERQRFVFEGPAATTLQILTQLYSQSIFRPFIEYVFQCIKEGELPKAIPPSDAANN